MKIVVIGAGIGGLTFSAALRRFAPEAEIQLFERDLTRNSQFHGYGIDLDKGGEVLKSLGLDEELSKQAIEIRNYVFCDQSGKILLRSPANGKGISQTQRVNRSDLETSLLQAMGNIPIHQGMSAKSFRQNDQKVEIQFGNGQTASADYVIACDGSDSIIRQQMVGGKKHHIDLCTILVDSPHQINHPLIEGGYFMTLGQNGTSVLCHRQPGGVHLSYTVHASSEIEISGLSAGTLMRLIQHETRSWHEPIPEIASHIDPTNLMVCGYQDIEPLKRIRQGRVWLIGDAAHPMNPTQGEGASLAMMDAFELARLFGELSINQAREKEKSNLLERKIVSRGRKAILRSRSASQRFHTTSHLEQKFRNIGFQLKNIFIQKTAMK